MNDIDGYTDYAAITTPIDTELYEERRNWLGRTLSTGQTVLDLYPNPKSDNLLRRYACDTNYKRDNDRADMPTIPITCRADMPATRLSDLSMNAFIDTRRVLTDNHRTWLTRTLLST